MLHIALALVYLAVRGDAFAVLGSATHQPKSWLRRASLPGDAEQKLPAYGGLNHVGVIVSNTAAAVAWYDS
jgi:hypothetical protein